MSNLYHKHHIWFPLVVFVSMMTIAGTVTFRVPGRAVGASGALPPMIAFTDLTSGPNTGNSDSSQSGQVAGQDGAIVTLWGKYLGSSQGTSQILVNGIPARIYTWANADHASGVADLYTRLGMQMVAFQIPHGAPTGNVTIQASVGGVLSNSLPFTVRAGKIYFVKTSGSDSAGDGSWTKPWQHITNNNWETAPAGILQPGDILYIGDGVAQTAENGDRATMYLDSDSATTGKAAMPKAMVGYPGAKASIGNVNIGGSWTTWIPGGGGALSQYWTISKLSLTANQNAASMETGFRVIGNYITAPKGDEPTGAVSGGGDHLYLMGNEITNAGAFGGSKLYHPVYLQSTECNDKSCLPAGLSRLPTEVDREVAWNYLHDNGAYDGINIYREGTYSAYMNNLRVHDNYIYNSNGRGMLIGEFITGNDNYIYNNVVNKAGMGPAPAGANASDPAWSYSCADIQAGGPGNPPTIIHFYNNTLYGCGFGGGPADTAGILVLGGPYAFTLDFHNNIMYSTGYPFVQKYSDSTGVIAKNNIWFGQGGPVPDPSVKEVFAGALTGDPKFVNAAAGDFHLQAGSAAIDTGTATVPVPGVDFDNAPRPQGSGYDIGAFEYGSGVTSGGGGGDTTPPSVPASLSVTGTTTSTVSLSWGASTDNIGIGGYRVYRNGNQVGTVTVGTTYVDAGLAASTAYSYTVAAYDTTGNASAQSSAVSGTTKAPTTGGGTGSIPVITSSLTGSVLKGSTFSYQIVATNNPVAFGASGFPTGFSINTATGLITGTANATGTFNVQLVATNNSGLGTAVLVLTVTAPVPPPPTPDTTAPSVSVTAPAANATVSGSLNMTANASDNVGVTKVEFYVDGVLRGTDTSSPYAGTFDTKTVSNGTHNVQAKAYDAAGNVGTSANVVITVNNIQETLGVTLTPSVITGTAPLSISLTAKITGTATGNTNYTFYCDRADAGTNITSPSDLTVTGAAGTTYTATNTCVYQNPGTYITKVIAQRGGAVAAQAQAQVVVSAVPTPTPPPVPTSTPVLIQSVKVSQITPTTAAITVTLNQAASIVVNYGKTTSYGSATQASPSLTTVYANLSNLTPDTVYDFNVVAKVQGSNAQVVSGNYVFKTQPNPTTPTSTPASSVYFPRNIYYRNSGNDVKLLNTVLQNLGFLDRGDESGNFFTYEVQHAMLLFQRAHNINRSGFLDLQSQVLLNKIVATNPKLANGASPSATYTPPFTRTLRQGMDDDQIVLLQELLREDGVYSFSNRISGYYGDMTYLAVKAFQSKYRLTNATPGVVDEVTRAKLNAVYLTVVQK